MSRSNSWNNLIRRSLASRLFRERIYRLADYAINDDNYHPIRTLVKVDFRRLSVRFSKGPIKGTVQRVSRNRIAKERGKRNKGTREGPATLDGETGVREAFSTNAIKARDNIANNKYRDVNPLAKVTSGINQGWRERREGDGAPYVRFVPS